MTTAQAHPEAANERWDGGVVDDEDGAVVAAPWVDGGDVCEDEVFAGFGGDVAFDP